MTDAAAAKTTVVLVVWDQYVGHQLTDALRSVHDQGVAAPIIVVDNASSVPLPELSDVTVIRSARRLTLGQARNIGLSEVTTPYAIFWDADDLMLPGALSFLEDAIESDPRFSAFAMAIHVDRSGERHRWPRRWVSTLVRAPRSFALLDSVWSIYPTTGATIMRSELVRAAGGYGSAESGEDWCLGVSLAFRGRIGWTERPGRIYRVHEGSVWARHMTVAHLLRHADAVRERLRTDAGIPRWATLALPLIQLGQYSAIALHAAAATARRWHLSRLRRER